LVRELNAAALFMSGIPFVINVVFMSENESGQVKKNQKADAKVRRAASKTKQKARERRT
jgi:hypothetical protein